MAINITPNTTFTVKSTTVLSFLPRDEYVFSAKSIHARTIELNGVPLVTTRSAVRLFDSICTWIMTLYLLKPLLLYIFIIVQGHATLPPLTPRTIKKGGADALVIGPESIAYFVLPDLAAPVCA